MEIIVCIKRVAATDSTIKVGSDGKSIDPAGVEFVLNPYDEYAVEEALRTKEKAGAGTVTAVSLGGPDAQKELRTCLAMGADRAVLLNVGTAELDAFNTAKMLAAWIKTQKHDVVFCGKQAVDGDDSQLPPRLAALLGLACVTEVVKIELKDGAFVAARDIEGAREVTTCKLPCVVSANKGLNEPRYASLKGIMAAKKKPLDTVEVAAVPAAMKTAALTLPSARPAGKILGTVDEVIAALRNEAKVF